jgi:hypothetical protein
MKSVAAIVRPIMMTFARRARSLRQNRRPMARINLPFVVAGILKPVPVISNGIDAQRRISPLCTPGGTEAAAANGLPVALGPLAIALLPALVVQPFFFDRIAVSFQRY